MRDAAIPLSTPLTMSCLPLATSHPRLAAPFSQALLHGTDGGHLAPMEEGGTVRNDARGKQHFTSDPSLRSQWTWW